MDKPAGRPKTFRFVLHVNKIEDVNVRDAPAWVIHWDGWPVDSRRRLAREVEVRTWTRCEHDGRSRICGCAQFAIVGKARQIVAKAGGHAVIY